ncbi:hypothetical protein JCM6292_1852 [Bacteroides pyogenes JCM 6292]|uniref:Uncharacterized protein n=2 Tax=Bacteroides pyogenes TaxID=310300 RepID=W4PHJ8_9BACE|nr:hypothetical protein JCM6292_1852 [Bacteroides pyogenes JCM 6292]GAE19291.1 hypothetical protein JCM6294_2324 [Bacteroides pyogenes DSM 20611 = JCM 6294]
MFADSFNVSNDAFGHWSIGLLNDFFSDFKVSKKKGESKDSPLRYRLFSYILHYLASISPSI